MMRGRHTSLQKEGVALGAPKPERSFFKRNVTLKMPKEGERESTPLCTYLIRLQIGDPG